MSNFYRSFIDYDRRPQSKWAALRLTDRDQQIFEGIHAYGGVLAQHHLHELIFPATNGRACQLRLSRLFHQGYLARTKKIGPFYWLTRQGREVVAASTLGGISPSQFGFTPRWSQLEHDMRTIDMLLAVQQACAASGGALKLSRWLVERDLRARVTAEQSRQQAHKLRAVIPDAYLQIERCHPQTSFQSRLLLEVDNATHPNTRFAEHKVIPGLAWLKSADYKQQFGAARGRWLVITTSEKRLAYLKATVEQVAGTSALIWNFTTVDKISAQTILTEPIWTRAGRNSQLVALFPPTP